jgi:NDP-sugar pyrophosphorylase family protein
MGIYAVNPELIPLIPASGIFGFDDLMALCLAREIPVRAYPFEGLWLDIGRPKDYASAVKLFRQHESRLFPQRGPAPRFNGKPHLHEARTAVGSQLS